MNIIRHLIFSFCLFISLLFSQCSPNPSKDSVDREVIIADTSTILHYNILITPDLSNRLDLTKHPRPLNDIRIMKAILGLINPTILKHKREMYQMDIFAVSFLNNQTITNYSVNPTKLYLDFSRFKKKQAERIQYINGTSGKKTLASDTNQFLQEFARVNQEALHNPFGADIWTYLNTGITPNMIKMDEEISRLKNSNTVILNKYRNILILLTDGYIEAGLKGVNQCISNKCYYLDADIINNFTTAFHKSGSNNIDNFFQEKQYGIIPVSNPSLSNLEVLVLELDDRSLSNGGNAMVHPTHNEVIQLFWRNWLKQSNVKRFELYPIAKSESEIQAILKGFIGIK